MIVYPPNYEDNKNPLIFLAGPIQGAPDWHSKAIKIIKSIDENIQIASPKRKKVSSNFTNEMYNEQVNWETHYLNRASKNGVILFWLAKEKDHICERAYAQTSRFELAEWYNKSKHNIIVGIEKGFSGEKYIRKRLDIHIYNKLEDVCKAATFTCKTNRKYNNVKKSTKHASIIYKKAIKNIINKSIKGQ